MYKVKYSPFMVIFFAPLSVGGTFLLYISFYDFKSTFENDLFLLTMLLILNYLFVLVFHCIFIKNYLLFLLKKDKRAEYIHIKDEKLLIPEFLIKLSFPDMCRFTEIPLGNIQKITTVTVGNGLFYLRCMQIKYKLPNSDKSRQVGINHRSFGSEKQLLAFYQELVDVVEKKV